jgi:hypothetical protein
MCISLSAIVVLVSHQPTLLVILDVYSGSVFFIQDPGSGLFHPGSRNRNAELTNNSSIFKQKVVTKLSEYDPRCLSRILIFFHTGSRGQKSNTFPFYGGDMYCICGGTVCFSMIIWIYFTIYL